MSLTFEYSVFYGSVHSTTGSTSVGGTKLRLRRLFKIQNDMFGMRYLRDACETQEREIFVPF